MSNQAFLDYTDKTVHLHQLIAKGLGDDPEADNLRMDMDDLRPEIPSLMLDLATNLSGDLYMLSGEDMYRAVTDDECIAYNKELLIEVENQKWIKVLELLRINLKRSKHTIALLRARAWIDLNPNVSKAFLDCALRLP